MSIYTYPDNGNNYNTTRLSYLVQHDDKLCYDPLQSVSDDGTTLSFQFANDLTIDQKAELDNVVATYPTSEITAYSYVDAPGSFLASTVITTVSPAWQTVAGFVVDMADFSLDVTSSFTSLGLMGDINTSGIGCKIRLVTVENSGNIIAAFALPNTNGAWQTFFAPQTGLIYPGLKTYLVELQVPDLSTTATVRYGSAILSNKNMY